MGDSRRRAAEHDVMPAGARAGGTGPSRAGRRTISGPAALATVTVT
ncbi:MAG: hypothetical protein ACRDY3_12880 [Acidimicrobiales bacterium]